MVSDQFHFCAFSKNCRVLHPLLIVRRLKRHGPIHEHYRDHVLQTQIWHGAVIDDHSFLRGASHHDLFHLLGLEPLFLEQRLHCVKWRLDRRTYRPFLDVSARHLVSFSECFNQLQGIGLW